jgi:hypothetical protein
MLTDSARLMPTAELEVPLVTLHLEPNKGQGDSLGLSASPHFRGKRFLLGEYVYPPIGASGFYSGRRTFESRRRVRIWSGKPADACEIMKEMRVRFPITVKAIFGPK